MTKRRRYPVKRSTILRLELAIHANAVRLFTDACILYKAASYPSSYALGILAFEELGKLDMVDHVGFEAQINGLGSKETKRDMLEHLFSRDMFYSHKRKQIWGVSVNKQHNFNRKVSSNRRIERYISAGALDLHKQDSLYVGYSNNRISLPSKFKPYHAYEQLEYTLKLFINLNDMPFVTDADSDSTDESLDRASEVISQLTRLFITLKNPEQLEE